MANKDICRSLRFNDRKWTILYPSVSMPPEWLSAVESFMCGTRYNLHFNSKPSCAMALTREEAEFLLKIAKSDLRPPYHPKYDDKTGVLLNPRLNFEIVEVPWVVGDFFKANKESADNE